jgi:hypothetical protein
MNNNLPDTVRDAHVFGTDLEWLYRDVVVLVDEYPERSDRTFVSSPNDKLYVGRDEIGWTSYFAAGWDGRGFGGASFDLDMADGTTETLTGPYSSRSGVINKAVESGLFPPEIEPVVDVILVDREEKFDRERDRIGGRADSLAISTAESVLSLASDQMGEEWGYRRETRFDDDEPYYVPRRHDAPVRAREGPQ